MEIFKINNYQNLSNASSIINSYIDTINADNLEITTLIEQLNDSEVFMGPTCDSLIDGWEKVKEEFNTKSSDLIIYANYLNLTNFMYKQVDNTNSTDISNV